MTGSHLQMRNLEKFLKYYSISAFKNIKTNISPKPLLFFVWI